MSAGEETVYIKADLCTVVTDRNVKLDDVLKIECSNAAMLRQIKQMKLYTFPEEEKNGSSTGDGTASDSGWKGTGNSTSSKNGVDSDSGSRRTLWKNRSEVFSILKVIERIHVDYPKVDVVSLGEQDFAVEYAPNPMHPKWLERLKLTVLCIVIFFGAAFTIMAFNNDISITNVFAQFYHQVMGKDKPQLSELEVFYCIGLSAGISIFFNHIGHKKITPDPTPVQIEMRKYEKDMDMAFIENAGRKGHSQDVD